MDTIPGKIPVEDTKEDEESKSDNEDEAGNDNISLMKYDKCGEIPDIDHSVQQPLKELFATL